MKAKKVWIGGQVGGEDISIPKTATPKWMKRIHFGMKMFLKSHSYYKKNGSKFPYLGKYRSMKKYIKVFFHAHDR